MGDTITDQNDRKVRRIKRIIDIALAILLIIAVIVCYKICTSDINEIEKKSTVSVPDTEDSDAGKTESNGIQFSSQLVDNDEVHAGSLIVINKTTEYKGESPDLVSMYDILNADGTDAYTVMNSSVRLEKTAASALNDMIKDFAAEKKHKDIVVDGGYRSLEYQQELYDAAEDKESAAKPGTSDYHSGCSIDLSISTDDGVGDFDGIGDYEWFEKNCWKYGYILRFPELKKDKTGYDYRPWHFRYVGKEHAYYMDKSNLCLEEYVSMLKGYTYDGKLLTFSDGDGNEYNVYCYPADTASDSTMLAVPSEFEYRISGNNIDGFIVSFTSVTAPAPVKKDESSADKPEATTEASESDSENNDEADEDADTDTNYDEDYEE